jgi:hypothetical protein
MSKTIEDIGLIAGGIALMVATYGAGSAAISIFGLSIPETSLFAVGMAAGLSGTFGLLQSILNPNDTSVPGSQQNDQDSAAYRRVIYGYMEVSGVKTFDEAPAGNQPFQNEGPRYNCRHQVYTVSGTPIISFQRNGVYHVVIDGITTALKADPGGSAYWIPADELNPWSGNSSNSGAHIGFEFSLGDEPAGTQPFPELASACADWGPTCTQTGRAKVHVVMIYDDYADGTQTAEGTPLTTFQPIYVYGAVPTFRFQVTGVPIIDTRNPGTPAPTTMDAQAASAVQGNEENGEFPCGATVTTTGGSMYMTGAGFFPDTPPSFEINDYAFPDWVDPSLVTAIYAVGSAEISQAGAPASATILANGNSDWGSPGEPGPVPGGTWFNTPDPGTYALNLLLSPTLEYPDPATFPLSSVELSCAMNESVSALATVTVSDFYLMFEYSGVIPTVPGTGVAANPSNPALIIYDYLTNTEYGMAADPTTIDIDSINAAANLCEETVVVAVASNNGTVSEYLYSCNGVFDQSSARGDVLKGLVASCAGTLLPPGDLWHLFGGAYNPPTANLTDADLRDVIKMDFRISRRDICNGVKGTFMPSFLPTDSTEQQPMGWRWTDFPPYQGNGLQGHPDYITEDGNQIIWKEVRFGFCTSIWQAQRLAKIVLMLLRFQVSAHLACKLTAFQVQAGDTITFTHARWAALAEPPPTVFFVTQATQVIENKNGAPSIGIDLVLRETDPSIYEFAAPTLYQAPGAAWVEGDGEYSTYGSLGVI